MGTRNTPLLETIIELIPYPDKVDALMRVETYFQDRLLVDAGSIEAVASHASHLRLQVDRQECSVVLDGIAPRRLVIVAVDRVEEVLKAERAYQKAGQPATIGHRKSEQHTFHTVSRSSEQGLGLGLLCFITSCLTSLCRCAWRR